MTGTDTVRYGLANRFLDLGLMVVVSALLIAVLGQFVPRLFDIAGNQSSVSNATTGIGYMRTYWQWLPLIVLVLGITMVVAGAAYESRRPGI